MSRKRFAVLIMAIPQGLWLQDRDHACRTKALPGQALNEGGQLFLSQAQLVTAPGFAPVELAPVQPAGTQPDAEAIVDQHLHSVAPFIGKQVGAMGLGGAKNLNDPR